MSEPVDKPRPLKSQRAISGTSTPACSSKATILRKYSSSKTNTLKRPAAEIFQFLKLKNPFVAWASFRNEFGGVLLYSGLIYRNPVFLLAIKIFGNLQKMG